MEKAMLKAERSKNDGLRLWAYTNLADYYGHAGRINDSYAYYLKALALDPQNAYAKKGIAWIVFSYEKDPVESLRILDSVTVYYSAPDYYLLKSEIAAYMEDDSARQRNLDNYFKIVDDIAYGAMYNAYTLPLLLDEGQRPGKALDLAMEEVHNRPTAHSYGLLAYYYFKMGDHGSALSIIDDHVIGRTYEPGVLLFAAEIYKGAGRTKEVTELKEELAGAVYELGPSGEERISNL
jgi:tetratricopeptide (TPR) repeat protein